MTATLGGSAVSAGVDVYNGDGNVDWQRARQSGQLFGYVKASEGVTEIDAHLRANLAGMKAAGILRGAYHFFRMNADPKLQALHFVNAVKAAGYDVKADMPLCVDIEEDSLKGGAWSSADVIAALARFNSTVEALSGRRNLIYVDRSTAEQYLDGGTPFSGHDLWHAQYTNAPVPHLPYGWKSCRIWQFSEFGTVPGVGRGSVDQDRFMGDEAALRAWASPIRMQTSVGGLAEAIAMAIPQSSDVAA